MRKLVTLTGALGALLAPAAASANTLIASLSASVTRSALTLHTTTRTDDGSVPPPSVHAYIRLGKGLAIDPLDARRCQVATNCNTGSQVGAGSAIGATVLAGSPFSAPVNVIAYNGPRMGGLFSLVLQLTGLAANTYVGTLRADSAPYGAVLDLPVPPPALPGGTVSLTQFNTTIGGSSFPNTGGTTKPVSSKRTFTIASKATKSFHLLYPNALQFAGATKSGRVKLSGSGLKVLSKGSAEGGSVYRVKVRNNGKGTGRVTITATSFHRWQYVSVQNCPAGGIRFQAVIVYQDGRTTTANTAAPCPT
ncbi:MAG: hypothetical protein DLM63_01865 [Solirubrobacterales bacterium]|nr:MAG: hypothetical protein DLM63_01865 [Solirubrobacterales bacterium]